MFLNRRDKFGYVLEGKWVCTLALISFLNVRAHNFLIDMLLLYSNIVMKYMQFLFFSFFFSFHFAL